VRELPEVSPCAKGRHGPVAKPDAHSSRECLAGHEDALCASSRPERQLVNNAAERAIRMAKVKVKASGRFRTPAPHPGLSWFDEAARARPLPHHPDRARRRSRRHGRAARGPTMPDGGEQLLCIQMSLQGAAAHCQRVGFPKA